MPQSKLPSRPRLLFLTPIIPDSRGPGSLKRAETSLQAYARFFDVRLAIFNRLPSVTLDDVPASVRNVCEATLFLDVVNPSGIRDRIARISNERLRFLLQAVLPLSAEYALFHDFAQRMDLSWAEHTSFDVVHAYRLRLAPVVEAMRNSGRVSAGRFVLDIDDLESQAVLASARVQRSTLGVQTYWECLLESRKLARTEARQLRKFDQVWVCSDIDRERVRRMYGCKNVGVVPISVPSPAGSLQRMGDASFTFLFVGSFPHPPNADAAIYFAEAILPLIRERSCRAFKVMFVGRRPTSEVLAVAKTRDIEVVGDVADVSKYYQQCDVVLAPVRFGSGIRVKIIEAFTFQRAVVCTTAAAEGLHVVHEENALVGDTAENFAAHCLRLMDDEALRHQLAAAGNLTAMSLYSTQAVERAVARLCAELVPTPVSGRGDVYTVP